MAMIPSIVVAQCNPQSGGAALIQVNRPEAAAPNRSTFHHNVRT